MRISWGLTALVAMITMTLYIKSIVIHKRIVNKVNMNNSEIIHVHYRYDVNKIIIILIAIIMVILGYIFVPFKKQFISIVGLYIGIYIFFNLPGLVMFGSKVIISDIGIIMFDNVIEWKSIIRCDFLSDKWSEDINLIVDYHRKEKKACSIIKIRKREKELVKNTLENHGYKL